MDTVFLIFFATHIPITLFVDAQAVLGPIIEYPSFARNALKWWCDFSLDPLMIHATRRKPSDPWFHYIVVAEILFQIPCFFVLIHAIWHKKKYYALKLIYSSHVCTTLIPILGEIYELSIPDDKKLVLFAAYLPYFVIPFLLLLQTLQKMRVENAAKQKRE
ncbi:transmembrane protein 6/97 [Gorgonomyces haynaldii]|nr:transmembrane protein 6/97 [Gorgonomyces haynaldii]